MDIDFTQIDFQFSTKPLVIGGKAMEYYGLRKSGSDIDIIVTKDDLAGLVKKYPNNLKDLYGDFGIATHGFEIWKTIRYFDYDFYSYQAIEEKNFLIISLEKLLFQKALAKEIQKYQDDLQLIVKKILDDQYRNSQMIEKENEALISSVSAVQFIEKKPE